MKRLITAALVAAALIMSCAGDGDRSSPVTLMIGGAPAELDYWEKVIGDFTRETGIAVDLMRQPTDTDQRRQSLVVPLRAGEEDPDVFLMDIVWIGQFAASGWLEPLDGRIAGDGFNLNVFFQGIIEFADRYEGHVVAMPVYVDAGLLYYRKDIFQEHLTGKVPETWPELVEYCRVAQRSERRLHPDFWGFVWQGAQYEGLVCTFMEFALSNGGQLIDRNGNLTLDDPKNIEALEFMRDLIVTHKVSPPNTYTEMKEEEVRTFFESGQALFERNWPYAWGLHQAEGSPVKDRVGIALLPRFEGGRHAATLGGWHIGMSRSSDRKQDAWRLMQYIVSEPVQTGFALNLGWNPARQDVYNSPEIVENLPHLVALKQVFRTASPRPNLPYYSLLSRALQAELSKALSGMATAEEALKSAQAQGLEIMATYEE
ncbi:MAG: ABC transporter substrate-binding protein [bacterium]|jgi:multiple sugar transport system substrate-binding protein